MKKLIIFLLIISALPLMGWLFKSQILSLYLEKQKNESRKAYFHQSPEARILDFQEKIDEDIKILSTYPIFTNIAPGTVDAASFLNPKVSWNLSNNKKRDGTLILPTDLLELLNSKDDFNELSIEWEKWNLDFSFFQSLHQYDLWSFDSETPFISNEINYKIEEIPQINYSDLIKWSKLRLLYGRDHNDLNQAIKDVSHLAKLVMSNETSTSSMATISILRVIAKIKKTPEIASETIPLEHVDIAQRFFWAQENFLDLRLGAETFSLFSENSVGLCSRINEALTTVISYRRLVDDDLSEKLDRLNEIEKKTRKLCRSSYIRKAWANKSYQGFFDESKSVYETVPVIFGTQKDISDSLSKIFPTSLQSVEVHPQMSGAVGFILLSINSNNKMKVYEQL